MTHRLIRLLCLAAVLTAALGAGCSATEDAAATPTSPTPTASGSTSSPTPQSCLPAAPSNLRVTITDSTRVFTWNAVSNVQDYFIQIGFAGSDDFLVNTNTSQTTYTWTGAERSSYWARVYARNACGSGPNSQQIYFN